MYVQRNIYMYVTCMYKGTYVCNMYVTGMYKGGYICNMYVTSMYRCTDSGKEVSV